MCKSYFICILLSLATVSEAESSVTIQSGNSDKSVSTNRLSDKPSWQRLNLMLSSTYWHVVKEGQVDLDSSLLYASRLLGLSRLTLLAEGIEDAELLAESQWIDQRNPEKGNRILSQSTGQKRLEMLLLLASYYVFEPHHSFKSDSVKYFLNQVFEEIKGSKDNQLKNQALCLLGKMFFKLNDVPRADSVYNSLTKSLEAIGDKEKVARAYEYWGLYSPFSPVSTQNRIEHLQKAADIYRKLDLFEGEINSLTAIGYLFVASGKLPNAYDTFLKALSLADSIQYPYIHYNTDALAMVTLFQGKFGEPLKYNLQTIKVAESTQDSIGWAYFYARLSALYKMEGGKEKECLDWTQKAFDRFVIDKNPGLYGLFVDVVTRMNKNNRTKEALELITRVYKTIPPVSFSEIYWYEIALSRCYQNLSEFDLAKRHLEKADSMETKAESFRGPLRKALIYYDFGYLFRGMGQYREARSYFEKYLATQAPASRMLGNDVEVYRELINIDRILGDNASGMAHYKQYAILLDSNYRVSKVRQAEELQVMYQTQEKENQIASLHQRAALEQANLKQAILVKNLTMAGIVATLIIVGLLYRQNRVKQKNNSLIIHKNEQLQHLLTEKEWLLKEIHHRVKNNLQIVMSLLNSQSAFIDNESALTAIHDSQHRVHAMSLIHQKLYNSENLSSIDMSFYIRELASYLRDSFSTGQRIHFEFNIESLQMDVSQAVPLGLILNEAITNSIKYAFPDEKTGVISISLSHTSPHHYLLIISDNGIGMPHNISDKKHSSLGMSLMEGLSEDLDGSFSIKNHNGTTIQIAFVHDPVVKRPVQPVVSSVPT